MTDPRIHMALRNHLYKSIYQAREDGLDTLADAMMADAIKEGIWKLPRQTPTLYFDELAATPVHDPANFWFVELLEKNADAIRQEVGEVTDRFESGFKPVNEKIYEGTWDQIFLYLDGRRYDDNCSHFPVLAGIIDQIEEVTSMAHGCAILSWIQPGTKVTPHCGPTNARLRCHMGIQIPDGARIRILDDWMAWEEGKCLVFDDSFEHEVIHDGDEPRIILLLDFWHPDATPEIQDIASSQKRDDRTPAQKLTQRLQGSGIKKIALSADGAELSVTLKSALAEDIKTSMAQQGLGVVGLNDDGELEVTPRLLALLQGMS